MVRFIAVCILVACSLTRGSAQPSTEDYKVYSALLKQELRDSAKSVEIIRKSLRYDPLDSSWAHSIRARDTSEFAQIDARTTGEKGKPVRFLDNERYKLMLDFFEKPMLSFQLENKFDIKPKVIFLKKTIFNKRFRKAIDEGWKRFYKKYPGSSGIFQFSSIYYAPNEPYCVFYYEHHVGGLNAHGSLAIMEKTNDGWKVKYRVYLWEA